MTDFDLDFLMACRFAYYCRAYSLLEDAEYDAREAEWVLINGPLPVGSSNPEDYTPAQRALALYFMLSGRIVARSTPRKTHPSGRDESGRSPRGALSEFGGSGSRSPTGQGSRLSGAPGPAHFAGETCKGADDITALEPSKAHSPSLSAADLLS